MENTIGIDDAVLHAMEDPIPIEKKNNTDAEEADMRLDLRLTMLS